METTGSPWDSCQVCGHVDHTFRHHLNEVGPPDFVRTSVKHLRDVERVGAEIHPVVMEVSDIANNEEGGRKAWALWLKLLLEEIEEASDTPEVVAEIENFLIGGYSS